MAHKIYTKTGDKGETGLFGGARLPKYHDRIEAYGTVDELNAHVGYLYEMVRIEEVQSLLETTQNRLFNIGSVLAVDPSKDFEMPSVTDQDITNLEHAIDTMDDELPELKQFILPSGHPQGAYAHIVRTVCRRAERRVVALAADEEVDEILIRYLNRLSDYLFTLARYLIMKEGGVEKKWQS